MLKSITRIFDRLIARFRVPGLNKSQTDLADWLNTPFGESLYTAELQACSRDALNIPGYRAAQLGISPIHSLLQNFPHEHKFILASLPSEGAACICDYAALPLPSNTLNTTLLHHALDFSPEPHKVLNETARAVAAGGNLIIIGFNPFSLFGMAKWLAGLVTRNPVWRHNSLRKARLIDWLQLIGFQIVSQERGKWVMLNNKNRTVFHRRVLEWIRRRISSGAFYVVVARKQVIPLIPIRHSNWQPVKIPAFAGLKTIGKGGDDRSKGSSYEK